YWIVLIVLLAGGYFLHLKRYCKAFRHDRDALLAARSKLDNAPIKKCLKSINNTFNNDTDVAFSNGQHLSLSSLTNSRR
ncbi:hypothetical protein Q2462_27625, partial [Escherichia coli]|nr:hypothetical protein [Escherichia coli]